MRTNLLIENKCKKNYICVNEKRIKYLYLIYILYIYIIFFFPITLSINQKTTF